MAKSQNTSADPICINVTASTDNKNDEGYQHCFEQKKTSKLTFVVTINRPVDNINFVLWDIHDPVKPYVEKSGDYSGKSGKVEITIGPDPDIHLGPGPYCAALTASNSAAASDKGAGEIVGNALYYYETWPRRIY